MRRRLVPVAYVNLVSSSVFLLVLTPLMLFRLDRTAFPAGTHAATEAYHRAQQPETLAERLRVAMYLNSVAFNFDLNNPPRLDRTAFSCRAHARRDDG